MSSPNQYIYEILPELFEALGRRSVVIYLILVGLLPWCVYNKKGERQSPTYESVAKEYGITRGRVREIEDKADKVVRERFNLPKK